MYKTLIDLFNNQPILFVLVLLGAAFACNTISKVCHEILLLLKPKQRWQRPIDLATVFNDPHNKFGHSEKYYQGYIRATEVIRNGSDPDTLLKMSEQGLDQNDFDKGWRDACEYHVKQKKEIANTLATYRTGIKPEDEELLNTES